MWHTKITSFTEKCKYGWLIENTNCCTYSRCDNDDNNRYKSYKATLNNDYYIYGYWTQTPVNIIRSVDIWKISSSGHLWDCSAHICDSYGIRPVVTISNDVLLINIISIQKQLIMELLRQIKKNL